MINRELHEAFGDYVAEPYPNCGPVVDEIEVEKE